MAKIHPSWWNLVLDGKLHHLEAGSNPYRSIASLRSAIYREAAERGLGVVTHLGPQGLFFQSWRQSDEEAPWALSMRLNESTPAPGTNYRAPLQQVAGVSRPLSPADRRKALAILQAHDQAKAQVAAAGLDPEDQDLVEERLYCTCGLGNATEGKVHDPGCGVWS